MRIIRQAGAAGGRGETVYVPAQASGLVPQTLYALSFSRSQLEKKLRELNTSLQNIQSVSNWPIHYRKQAKLVVAVWYKDLQN